MYQGEWEYSINNVEHNKLTELRETISVLMEGLDPKREFAGHHIYIDADREVFAPNLKITVKSNNYILIKMVMWMTFGVDISKTNRLN